MKAVIMAGGKGSRLRPLTCDLPKPMVPIANRPMMEYIVELLVDQGFQEVAVTLCYLPEVIQNHFKDGRDFGLQLRYYLEDKPLGTAGSVRNAEDFLDETFVVVSGDALTDFDLQQAVDFHRSRGAIATLVLTRVTVPLQYGVVVTDDNGAIKRFLEKPGWSQVFSDTVNTGIYVLEPEVFKYFEPDQEFDFSKDLFPRLLAAGEPLFGYVAEGYWSDVGNLEVYRQAHMDALEGKVNIRIPGEKVEGGIWLGSNVQIHPSATVLGPAVLGDGCQVGPRSIVGAYSCIGENCVLAEGVTTKRTIVWDGTHLDRECELRGTIVGDDVSLYPGVRLFENSVVASRSSVGRNTTVRPGVKIWPGKHIPSDTTVDHSVVWADKVSRSIFGANGIDGYANLDLTPEVMAQVGAALGTTLAPGSEVAVGGDLTRTGRMLKRSFMAGLASAGISALDLGTSTVPLVRFAAVRTGGGAYVQLRNRDSGRAFLTMFDQKGLPYTQAKVRKVENQFFRGDFRRAAHDDLGTTRYEPAVAETYLQWLLGCFSQDGRLNKVTNRFTVVADAGPGAISVLLRPFLEGLGCRVIEASNYGKDHISEDAPSRLKSLQADVRRAEADMGVLVHRDGVQVKLVDDRGAAVPDSLFWPLVSYVLIELGRRELVVPVYASGGVEELAEKRGARVVRPGDMEKVLETAGKDHNDRNTVAPNMYLDGLALVGDIIRVVAWRASLSGLLARLPRRVQVTRTIPCRWEEKGKIMRSLIEQTRKLPRELVDGVKVFHEEGWALVLPDGEEPLVRLFCEAGEMEAADELARLYEEKISELRK